MVLAYLALINLAAFAAFWLDKRRAIRRARRIPERRLLGLAAAGGGAGAALARQLFRHKTVKEPFASRLRLILTLQAIAAGLALTLRR
jgi:uncharacterized membrane protein YsdA (DUF1294 family)